MKIADIVQQLQDLQIKQDELLSQLASKQAQPANSQPKPKEELTEAKPAKASRGISQELKAGDSIILLTGGIVARKWDKAKVTKVTDTAIHFVIDRNGHSTYKRQKNVRKVQ